MDTFIAVYLVIGIAISLVLFGWVAVASVRRHGVRGAARGAARAYVEELPLYWRVPVVGWLFVIGIPLVAAWAVANGEWDASGAVFEGSVWLLSLALLLWHYRAKTRGRRGARRSTSG